MVKLASGPVAPGRGLISGAMYLAARAREGLSRVFRGVDYKKCLDEVPNLSGPIQTELFSGVRDVPCLFTENVCDLLNHELRNL